MSETERIYKLLSVAQQVKTGKYIGKRPAQAALKALNKYCRDNKIDTCDNIEISIEETTKNSGKKQFNYIGKRIKLDEPKNIIKNGVTKYNVNFKSTVIKK